MNRAAWTCLMKIGPVVTIAALLSLAVGCASDHRTCAEPAGANQANDIAQADATDEPSQLGDEPIASVDVDGRDVLSGPRVRAEDSAQRQVVNSVCPMFPGGAVGKFGMCDTDRTRTSKGRTVGFCSVECCETWDRMSEEDREQALAAVTPPKPPAASKGK